MTRPLGYRIYIGLGYKCYIGAPIKINIKQNNDKFGRKTVFQQTVLIDIITITEH